ncbi:VOC family protein [Serinicoccus kebangsaanensis]|uniref:VOC family protein n=1 Tax=Serinicoccus kebangsaanensis TaxID=2602069 RepID=UPI00124E3D57|nr:VOC family protein [Serinicoccus kebangsaanensis]
MDDTAGPARTFPPGVSSWIDLEVPDVDAAAAFYGELFGWSVADVTPPGVPERYAVATLDGRDAAAIAWGEGPPRWRTYVATDDVDASLARAVELGGQVLAPAADAGPGGRGAAFTDPFGSELRLWQARARLGAQVANVPGAWNFSNLRTTDVAASARYYRDLFGWELVDQGWATAIQVPGYGDHLESTVDPDIRTRQAHAPEGFADTIGAMVPAQDRDPGWYVVFTVADCEATAAAAARLGGTVVESLSTDWTREAVLRDPQGATFTASQFTPPSDWD